MIIATHLRNTLVPLLFVFWFISAGKVPAQSEAVKTLSLSYRSVGLRSVLAQLAI